MLEDVGTDDGGEVVAGVAGNADCLTVSELQYGLNKLHSQMCKLLLYSSILPHIYVSSYSYMCVLSYSASPHLSSRAPSINFRFKCNYIDTCVCVCVCVSECLILIYMFAHTLSHLL